MTEAPTPAAFIGDAHLLVDRFGEWPSFHDAEVRRIELNREATVTCDLEIVLSRMTSHIDRSGAFEQELRTLVVLRCSGLTDAELSGFNHQNALMALAVSGRDGEVIVDIEGAYGVTGRIRAESVSVVRMTPLD